MLWLLLVACDEMAPRDVTVVYGARGQGEIEPCGCPERPVGGLDRRNGVLAQKRKEGPLVVVDAGQTLGPRAEDLDPRFIEQRRAKAELIATALAQGGIDAMALGANDWALGPAFVRQLVADRQLPVLAANLTCGADRPYPGGKKVEIGGRTLGLVGLTDGIVDGCVVGEAEPALRAAVEALGPVDAVLALVPYDSERTLSGHFPGPVPVDIVVDARGRAAQAGAEWRAGSWYAGAGSELHALSWMTLSFREGARGFTTPDHEARVAEELASVQRRLGILAERIAKAPTPEDAAILGRQADAYRGQEADLLRQSAELTNGGPRHVLTLSSIDLDATVATDPTLAKAMAETKAAIQRAAGAEGALAFMPRIVPDAHSPWLGGEGCVSCHRAQHAQWSTTAHVRAWNALKESERSMDQDCWSCHVTAANQVGGPALPTATAGFHDVQCEACHGPGRAHAAAPAENPLQADPGIEVCQTCHDGKRDGGRFDFASYRAKITH